MEIVRRETDYALRALTALARIPRGASASELAVCCRVPWPLMRKVLYKLSRAGLVRSARGARGGFRLARQPGRIRLGEVVRAIQGRVLLAGCWRGGKRCSLYRVCRLRPRLREFQRALQGWLRETTLATCIVPDHGRRR